MIKTIVGLAEGQNDMKDILLKFEYLNVSFYLSVSFFLISVGLIWWGTVKMLLSFINCYTATYRGEWSNQKKTNLRKAGVVLSLAIAIAIFWLSVDKWLSSFLLLIGPYAILSQWHYRSERKKHDDVNDGIDESNSFDYEVVFFLFVFSFWLPFFLWEYYSGKLVIVALIILSVWLFISRSYDKSIEEPKGPKYKNLWLKNSIIHIATFCVTYTAGIVAIMFLHELFVLLILSLIVVGVYYLSAWIWSRFWRLLFDNEIEKQIKRTLAILTGICILGGLALFFLGEIEMWAQEWEWLGALKREDPRELIDEY